MIFQGRVKDGVVVLTDGPQLADGTLVKVMPVDEVDGPAAAAGSKEAPYPVSQEQKEALLGLIGIWKTNHAPSDEEVEQIIEEARKKKCG